MKRRDFLKTTALGAAGALAAGSGLISCAPSTEGFNFNKLGTGAGLKLSFEPYELQLRHTFTVSSYSRKTTPGVQVRIDYEGFTGYGEASMPPYLGQTVESVTNFLSRTVLGQPWWRLWGLDPDKTPYTTFTIGIDTPDVVREKTKECADRFKILKVKVGLDNDKEMIRTIREVTDLPLAVDANQGWKDREQALDEIFWLKENGIVMVEQPMAKERLDDNAWITERSPLPIFADEAIQRLADIPSIKGAYHGINIKLMKSTGMREAWKMANYAHAEDMRVMIGCMTETSCAVSAAAQLSPLADFADLDGNLLISNDPFKGMEVMDGKVTLSDRPGIGLIK